MSWLRQGEDNINIKISLVIIFYVCRYTGSFQQAFEKAQHVILKTEDREKCKPSTVHLRWTRTRHEETSEQRGLPWQSKTYPTLHPQHQNSPHQPCIQILCVRWGAGTSDKANTLLSLSQSSLQQTANDSSALWIKAWDTPACVHVQKILQLK